MPAAAGVSLEEGQGGDAGGAEERVPTTPRPPRLTVCFGTRPETIKLFPVVRELRTRLSDASLHLLCTDQHDELLELSLGLLGDAVVDRLGGFTAGQPLTGLVARVVDQVGRSLRAHRPDAVIVQGDTASAFAGALAAFYEGIPVVHVEAGLRTGDLSQPYPEEFHRASISRLACLHLAPTEDAAGNLLDEGVERDRIVVTGNTGRDAVRLVSIEAAATTLEGVDPSLPFAVATLHRRESVPHLPAIVRGLRAGAHAGEIPVLLVLHPNPEISEVLRRELQDDPWFGLSEPLSFSTMLGALGRARFVFTDSGGVQEEACALGVPTLVARRKTDRPEGVRAGNAMVVGVDSAVISDWMGRLARDEALHAGMATPRDIYGDGVASTRIVDAILARFPGPEANP